MLQKHLTLAVVTRCPVGCTRWENGTRLSIENTLLADMTEDAAKGLTDFLYAQECLPEPIKRA